MTETVLKSYAKINIGLRILNKRDDGYHNLETIFYPIKLFDEIIVSIEPATDNFNSVILKSNKSFIPLNRDNLCYKSVEKFFTVFQIKSNFKIYINLKKNIPVGGGLGGGSSNASAVIRFLVNFFNIDVQTHRQKIIDIALSVGSDVPFFLMMKTCYASGRGEKMKLLKNFKIDYDILIVNPNLHVSTKWAFSNLNLHKGNYKDPLLNEVQEFDLSRKEIFENDFEEIVFNKFSLIRSIKSTLLSSGAVYASMSGSGATVYGFFEKNQKEIVNLCRKNFEEKRYFTFISA